MNDLKRPPRLDFDRRPDPLDGLLSRFFRSELPNPWPALPALPAPRTTPRGESRAKPRRRLLLSSRLALAAAVSFFLVGYLLLSGLFPKGNAPRVAPVPDRLGHNPKLKSPLHQMRLPATPLKGEVKQGFQPLGPWREQMKNGGEAEVTGKFRPGRLRVYDLQVIEVPQSRLKKK